jgi:hypothetical protein
MRKRLLIVPAVLALVIPAALTGGEALPELVSPAQAANCRLITVYGQEKSSVGRRSSAVTPPIHMRKAEASAGWRVLSPSVGPTHQAHNSG